MIALLILPRTFALLRDATDVLLEATPKGIDIERVRQHILEAPGVIDCHDLHAWTITSGMNVVSAHVIVADGADPAATRSTRSASACPTTSTSSTRPSSSRPLTDDGSRSGVTREGSGSVRLTFT